MTDTVAVEDMERILIRMGERALAASRALAVLAPECKNKILLRMAEDLEANSGRILDANAADMEAGRQAGLSAAMLDRLSLSEARISAMANGLKTVAAQSDPVGRILASHDRPNGLKIIKKSVPLGVIGIIYESRPNVTADAAGICLKAGNAVILRCGSEAIRSCSVLADILDRAAQSTGMPAGTVQLVPWTDRSAVKIMLKLDRYIDVIIPRGGEGLIRFVCAEATMPVLKHYKGVCHLYAGASADIAMAVKIVENAKCSRPGVCNALETLLIDRGCAEKFIPPFCKVMRDRKVELHADEEFRRYCPEALPAAEDDWFREYLDFKLAVKIVSGIDEAVEHINRYGSRHSDGIITENTEERDRFFAGVDSSTLYWNASTRFTDGGEFGMGAEIGISTDKLHARGPMGADELTSYKYLVYGAGQIR